MNTKVPAPRLSFRWGRALKIAVVLFAVIASPAWAGPIEDAAHARLIQEVLPSLEGRRRRAEAQAQSATALFEGRSSLAAAFPDLSLAPLFSLGFVQSEQRSLSAAAATRATARIAPPPPHLSARQIDRWRRAQLATLEAEERSDTARARVLDALSAGIARAPGLSENATAEMEVLWQALRSLEPDATPVAQAQAIAAGRAAGALSRIRQAARRRMLVPGDPSLETLLREDMAAQVPSTASWSPSETLSIEARLERMDRAAPLVDDPTPVMMQVAVLRLALVEAALPELRQAIIAEEKRKQEAEQSVALENIAELQAAADGVAEALIGAKTAAAAAGVSLEEAAPAVEGVVAQYHRLQVALYTTRLATAQLRIERRTRLARSGLSLDTRATDADIALAREKAAAARIRADAAADGEHKAAQLQKAIADLQAQIAGALEAEGARQDTAVRHFETLRQAIDEHAKAIDGALARSLLAGDREAQIDRVFGALTATIGELRIERVRLSTALLHAKEQAVVPDANVEVPDESEELTGALRDLSATQDTVQRNIEIEIDAIFGLLRVAKGLRRRLHHRTSGNLRTLGTLLTQTQQELTEVPAIARAWVRTRTGQVRALPGRLTEMHAWGGWLWGAFQLLVMVMIWIVVRRRSGAWIDAALATLDPGNQPRGRARERRQVFPNWMVGGDLMALTEPLTQLSRAGIDVLVAGSLLAFLTPTLPTAGVFVYGVLGVGLVRFIPALVGLVIITPSHRRPAIWVGSVPARALVMWTTRAVVIWMVIESGLVYIAENVLEADHFALLLGIFGRLILGLIAIVALHRWAPTIRAQLSSEDGPLERWASVDSSGSLGRTLRATVGAGVLMMRWLTQVGARVIDRRAGLNWIGAALARRQLNEDEQAMAPAVDAGLRSAIAQIAPARVQSAPAAHQIQSVFDAWNQDPRQGVVAIIGDRGMGKRRLIEQVRPVLAAGHDVVEFHLERRLTEPAEAMRWLAVQTGVKDFKLPQGDGGISVWAHHLSARMKELPSKVFILRNAHLLFLRSVGQFQALRAVLAAMQECSEHHFWLCTFHGPAWTFLDGVGEVINLSGVRTRVYLPPMDARSLSTWLEASTRAAGAEPGYGLLLHRDATGAERKRLIDRAARAYWRLMAEASQGNPEVALAYWLNGLRQGLDEGCADVGMFDVPEALDLAELSDVDLFVLTSLIIHCGATLDELQESLNLTSGEVLSTCRALQSRSVIHAAGGAEFFRVSDHWLPAVERLLRRRSFLHRR